MSKIFNTKKINKISISNIKEMNKIKTAIEFDGESIREFIKLDGDKLQFSEIIDQTILNTLNEQKFFSMAKLELAINQRIAQAEKKQQEYTDKE